jgi:hypothetical protein
MRNLQYIAENTSVAGIILGIVEKSKGNYAGISYRFDFAGNFGGVIRLRRVNPVLRRSKGGKVLCL